MDTILYSPYQVDYCLYSLCQVDYRVGNTDALSALVALACRARRDAVRVGAVRSLYALPLYSLTMTVL